MSSRLKLIWNWVRQNLKITLFTGIGAGALFIFVYKAFVRRSPRFVGTEHVPKRLPTFNVTIEDGIEDVFKRATEFVGQGGLPGLSQQQMLAFYALFKQSTVGPSSGAKAPSFWDYVGKAKWEAWENLGDMRPEVAMQQYVNLVDEFAGDAWRTPGNGVASPKRPTWQVMSVPQEEKVEEVAVEDQDFIYHCQSNNIAKALAMAHANPSVLDECDGDGVTGLLWACDRGHVELVEKLLKAGANIEQRDCEGSTPLHYAVMCEHTDLVEMLLERRANPMAQDNDGTRPDDLAEDPEVLLLLQKYSKKK